MEESHFVNSLKNQHIRQCSPSLTRVLVYSGHFITPSLMIASPHKKRRPAGRLVDFARRSTSISYYTYAVLGKGQGVAWGKGGAIKRRTAVTPPDVLGSKNGGDAALHVQIPLSFLYYPKKPFLPTTSPALFF